MNIIDKIMNALSLYDEEEIIEEEVEQKPAKTEQEPAKPKKRFFGSKEPAYATIIMFCTSSSVTNPF